MCSMPQYMHSFGFKGTESHGLMIARACPKAVLLASSSHCSISAVRVRSAENQTRINTGIDGIFFSIFAQYKENGPHEVPLKQNIASMH